MNLTGRRWGMWQIPYLMLKTLIAVAPLNRAAFQGVMPQLAAGIARHPRPIVGLLASTRVIVMIMIPRRSLIWTLRVEVFSLISLSLGSTLLIIIVVLFLHCSFHVHCGVV